MPKCWRRFFVGLSLERHLVLALIGGLILRALSAHFVYGPQALDDYKHGVWPAYQLFSGEPLSLPGYRSHLLVWLLSGFIQVGSFFGASSALTQVRCMYLGLGLISLLAVVGTYFYVRNFRSRIFGALAIYLMAFQGIMPFIGTRAFGEAVALPLILLGLGLLEDQRRRSRRVLPVLAGVLVLGLACFFRFQVGLIFLTYGLILLSLREWRMVAVGAFGGLVLLLLQAGVDLASGKEAFETLQIYLRENEGGASKYGVSPWYNTWAFVLTLTLFPFSIVFWRSAVGVWRRHAVLILPLLIFVFVHSLVAHKEERFLYPIVGLVWIVLAAFWAASSSRPWARRLYTPVFTGLNVLLILVSCFVNTQEGEIEPPAYAEKKFGRVLYLDERSLVGQSRSLFYFLRSPSALQPIEPEKIQVSEVDQKLRIHPELRAVVVMTSQPESLPNLEGLANARTSEARCEELRQAQSLVDRALFKLNPKHNQRRRPTWYVACARFERGLDVQ